MGGVREDVQQVGTLKSQVTGHGGDNGLLTVASRLMTVPLEDNSFSITYLCNLNTSVIQSEWLRALQKIL